MNRLITKPCSHCSIEVDKVTVRIFGLGFTLHRVRLMVTDGSVTTISADIPSLTIDMYPLALFEKQLHLGSIEIVAPATSVVEYDTVPPQKKQGDSEAGGDGGGPISVEVDGILLRNADFSYALDTHRREGVIRVHQIEAHVQRFGTTEELRKQKFHGTATGLLEKSGRFELSAAADFFSEKPDVDVELHLVRQQLADVNDYFHPADRVELEGWLLDGHTKVAVRGADSFTVLTATFEGLKFTAARSEARSIFQAFLLNLFGGLKMAEHNLYDSKKEKRKLAQLKREPGQSVLAFILHSMKAAALKLAARE